MTTRPPKRTKRQRKKQRYKERLRADYVKCCQRVWRDPNTQQQLGVEADIEIFWRTNYEYYI